MSTWKVIFIALLVALIVTFASNRNRIPIVNPGRPLFKPKAPAMPMTAPTPPTVATS